MSKTEEGLYGGVWTPVVMKPISPKKIVSEVYHRGTFIGGKQATPPPFCITPLQMQGYEFSPNFCYHWNL